METRAKSFDILPDKMQSLFIVAKCLIPAILAEQDAESLWEGWLNFVG
ncbi:MAG: hypothetical protein ACJ75B_13280 [Flavisolibacter sp.]